jgi:hypothetical protein
MQQLVHAATDPDVAQPEAGSGAAIPGPGQLQRWRWKHYPSSIEMWDGPDVGDNFELFARGNWKAFRGDDNICAKNQEMVQGAD